MNKYTRIVLQLLITVGVFVFLFTKFQLNLLSTLASINLWWLLLVIVLRFVVAALIYINRWKLFLSYFSIEESFWSLLVISLKSAFLGVALPSSQGADMARMYFIERRHHGASLDSTASSTVLIERGVGVILFSFLGLIAALFCDFPKRGMVLMFMLAINVVLWLAILVLTNWLCYRFAMHHLSKMRFLRRVAEFVSKTYHSLLRFPYRRLIGSSLVLLLLFQVNTVLILYCIFLAFGVNQIPLVQHFAFYPVIGMLAAIPISISGLGVREGFFVYFYSLVGVVAGTAVSISLVNYFVEILLPAILGGLVFLLDMLRPKRS